MINIAQKSSIKSIGRTSLFVSFDYNSKIVELVKSAENAIWHKDLKEWELPLNKLSYLINSLTYLDDIELSLLPDETIEKVHCVIKHEYDPFDYQQEGIEWLITNENGLLTDVPGLGKSLQAIYAAEELHAAGKADHCLIICGINNLKQNWKKEIQKFSTLSCRVLGEKITKKGKISYTSVKERAEELYNYIDEFFVILNIEVLRDSTIIDAIKDSENKFDIIICDEIHKLASPQSAQSKGFLKLSKVGFYHWGLTGTLLTNSPLNAYTPLKFIGEEKSTFSEFKNYYCQLGGRFSKYQIVGFKNIDILKGQLNNCSLRRTKDLLHLPPKTIIPEFIEMNTDQQKFYDELQNGVVKEADRVNIKTTTLLGLIVRLRQATSCPQLLTSTVASSSKIDRAADLVEEITSNNEKVVIFGSFKEPLYQLYKILEKYNPVLCTGDQSEIEASKAVDEFQNNPDCKVFLGTSQKAGTGLTLTAASYMIHIDTSWVYAEFEQACDRIYRVGTSKPVIIYDLICKDTIDERVYNVLNTKKNMSDYIIDDKVDDISELKQLLGLSLQVDL